MSSVPPKSSFIIYTDTLDILDHMSDEDAGQLFKAIKFYQENGTLPDLSPTVKVAIVPFIRYFEINHAAWLEKKEKRSQTGKENGAKGGRPKKPKITQNNPVGFLTPENNPIGFSETQNNLQKPTITHVTDTVTVTDNKNKDIKEKINNKEKIEKPVFDFSGFDDLEKVETANWIEYKAQIKKPYKTQLGLNSLRRHLLALKSKGILIDSLVFSIGAEYQGVFPPSSKRYDPPPNAISVDKVLKNNPNYEKEF